MLRALYQQTKLSILDKYLLKNYLITICYLIFVFIIISVSIDYSEKTDDFANPQVHKAEIWNYYKAFIPHIVSLLLSIFVFVSTVLFTSRLANRTEFIPMFSSGISMKRVLKPYILGGGLMASLLWVANLELLPRLNIIKADFLTKYVDGRPPYTHLDNYAIKLSARQTLDMKYYDTKTQRAKDISVYEIFGSHIQKLQRADSLIWDSAGHRWLMKNIHTRSFEKGIETTSRKDTAYLHTFVQPSDFHYDSYLKEKLSSQALRTKIEQEVIKGSGQINLYKVELYKRDATPFSIIVLSVIAAIISSRKIRGGSGIHLSLAFVISALYIAMDRFSTVLSINSGLQPLLAVWLPNILFSLVALYLYKKAHQ